MALLVWHWGIEFVRFCISRVLERTFRYIDQNSGTRSDVPRQIFLLVRSNNRGAGVAQADVRNVGSSCDPLDPLNVLLLRELTVRPSLGLAVEMPTHRQIILPHDFLRSFHHLIGGRGLLTPTIDHIVFLSGSVDRAQTSSVAVLADVALIVKVANGFSHVQSCRTCCVQSFGGGVQPLAV